jgi:hypothetical protein
MIGSALTASPRFEQASSMMPRSAAMSSGRVTPLSVTFRPGVFATIWSS